MANEAEQAIYNKLAAAPTFHPSTTDLLPEDWALEPGDIVTVQSDGENYLTPVYSMNLDWNGASKVSIQSTGNKKREPLSALQRRQFSGARSSYRTQKELEETQVTYTRHFTATDKRITSTMTATGVLLDEDGDPVTRINPETGEEEYVFDESGATLSSKVIATAGKLETEVSERQQDSSSFTSQIQQMARKIALVVTQKDGQDVVNAASIVLGINNQDKTSESYVDISADKINLTGYVTATTLDARLVKADALFTTTGYAGTIYAGNVQVNGSGGTVTSPLVYATSQLSIGSSSGGGTGSLYYRGQQYYRQGITLGQAGAMIAEGQFLGNSSTSINLNHFHDIDIEEVQSGSHAGQMQVTLGAAVATTDTSDHIAFFKIADTAYYRSHVGIDNTGTWVWEPEDLAYIRHVTARDATVADITLPTISMSATLGTSQSATVSAKGPAGSSTPAQKVASDIQLYLQTDAQYAYITTNTGTPTAGQNIVARVTNTGGGTGTITEDGWAWSSTLGVYEDIVRGSNNTLSVNLPTITLTATAFDANHKSRVNAVGPADGSGNSHAVATSLEVDAGTVYTDGATYGRGQMGIAVSWADNVASISAAQSSVKNDTITVTAAPVIKYNSSTHEYSIVAAASADGDVVYTSGGSLSGTQAYTDGVTTGRGQMGVSMTVDDNVIYASVTQSNTKNDSVTITAIPSVVYNSTTHQYTITASAKADNDVIYTSGGQGSGTQAYTDGVTIGRGQIGVSLTLDDNVVQAAVVQSDTKSDSLTITAVPSIVYNNTTHQYTITASAKADDEVIYTSGGQGIGTQAYTDGQNSVNVSKGSWSNGGITFSPSVGTGSSASVQLSKGTETWNGNVCTFPILDSSSNTGLTCSVTAPSQVFSVSGNWSGGSYIVKDNHNTERLRTTLSSIVTNGTPTKSEISDTILSVPLKVLYDDGEDGDETGFATSVSVNATPIWNAAAATASVPGNTSTDKSTFTFTGPLTNGSAYSYDYTLSVDSTYCYVRATASGNLKLRIPNSFSPVKLEGYTASDATGYFSSEGVYIKHPGTHYYIRSHGTGSDGSGAQVYLVVCLRAQNSAGSYFYHSNLDSMGSGVPIGQSSSTTIMKNQVLKGPVTSIYVEGYKEGYKNANAITYTAGWNGSGTYTVTAKRDGTTIATRSTSPTLRLNGNGSANFSAELYSDTSSPVKQKSIPCYLIQDGNVVKACGKSDGTEVVGSITVSGSGGSATSIDLQVRSAQKTVPSVPSDGTRVSMTTLSNYIAQYSGRSDGPWYIPIDATISGGTGTKRYYITLD